MKTITRVAMRLEWRCRLALALCLLPMVACDSSTGSTPPADTYRVDTFTFISDGKTETISGATVKPTFFPAADPPLFGRLFNREEYRSGSAPVVVLRHQFWQERFHADPTFVGRTVRLNGQPYTIVGVMQPRFDLPSGVELWVPWLDFPN